MPSMTKKHYEAIASILAIDTGYTREVAIIAERLADYFASDNPRFDRVRFLTACGIEQEYHECNVCGHYNAIRRDRNDRIVGEWCAKCKN